jgi:hypothetical protein
MESFADESGVGSGLRYYSELGWWGRTETSEKVRQVLGSFQLQDLALEVSKLPRKFSNRSRNVPEGSFFFLCLKWRMELRVTPGVI